MGIFGGGEGSTKYQPVDLEDEEGHRNDEGRAASPPATSTKPWEESDDANDLTGDTAGESSDEDGDSTDEHNTLLEDGDEYGEHSVLSEPLRGNHHRRGGNDGSGRRSLWLGAVVALAVVGGGLLLTFVLERRRTAPLRRLSAMRADFEGARRAMEIQLRREYGSYYDALFTRDRPVWDETAQANVTRAVPMGKLALASQTPENKSADRMRRRLARKLLQVLLAPPASKAEPSSNQGNFTYPPDPHLGEDTPIDSAYYDPSPLPRKHDVSFVWASGGHSAAAGHGNLYAESYTAYLERIAHPVFDAVGMDLEGRNYAMGGFRSYPETALCVDELYGTDVDVLSWDFGMTDGFSTLFGIYQYFYQASLRPNRPACVALEPAGDKYRPQGNVMRELEDRGLTAFTLALRFDDQEAIDRIPESFGMGDAELNELPPYVRNFKCESAIEKGLPYCDRDKFTDTYCRGRKFQTGWHPGWKWQALRGNYLALGLVEFLGDALAELDEALRAQDYPDPHALLEDLQWQHDDDYRLFEQSEVPVDEAALMAKYPLANVTQPPPDSGYSISQLYQRAPFCHTALLPSEIRYKGILTSDNAAGDPTATGDAFGPLHFDHGISQQSLLKRNYSDSEWMSSASDRMTLSFDEHDRQHCEVPANLDYKDFFFVHQPEGWRKVVLPTDTELAAYAHKKPPAFEGRIALCLPGCDWGHCPDQRNLKNDALVDGRVEIRVNGLAVTAHDNLNGCSFLRHGYGDSVFPPNEEGKFDIRARVLQEDGYVQISSFIIW